MCVKESREGWCSKSVFQQAQGLQTKKGHTQVPTSSGIHESSGNQLIGQMGEFYRHYTGCIEERGFKAVGLG